MEEEERERVGGAFYRAAPCLDDIKILSFFTLFPSYQFLTACIEY
jgi:hypothetical protein